jgi:transcription antitermination factor NusG
VWLDSILPKLSVDSISRYVESLQTICIYANQYGLTDKADLFDQAKEYVQGGIDGGMDKESLKMIESIRKIAAIKRGSSEKSAAIDVYVFSFFHAGLDVDDIIGLRFDSSNLCELPHTEEIKNRYKAPIKKYVFPLGQGKRTTKKIKESLEQDFKSAAKVFGADIEGKTSLEFVRQAWVATARSCGVKVADICALCPWMEGNAVFENVKPSELTRQQKENIKRLVANQILDMRTHWYALRFFGEKEVICEYIEMVVRNAAYKTYYPIEEIFKKTGKKIKTENRPTLKNVLFIETLRGTFDKIIRLKKYDLRYRALTNNTDGTGDYAIIPDEQMRKFSALVSNGLDICGEEEIKEMDVTVGDYVSITEGQFAGYSGYVLKVRDKKDKSQTTMLQIKADKLGPHFKEILGANIYITVPQNIASKLS